MRARIRMTSLAAAATVALACTALFAAGTPAVAAQPIPQVAYAEPSGGQSGYAADSLIRVVGVDGSADHSVSTDEPAAEPAWNPSGTLLAFTALLPGGGTSVHVIDPSTGAERAVTPAGWRTPLWSPDGSQLAVISGTGAEANLGVVSAAGGDPTVVIAWDDHGGDDAIAAVTDADRLALLGAIAFKIGQGPVAARGAHRVNQLVRRRAAIEAVIAVRGNRFQRPRLVRIAP